MAASSAGSRPAVVFASPMVSAWSAVSFRNSPFFFTTVRLTHAPFAASYSSRVISRVFRWSTAERTNRRLISFRTMPSASSGG